MIAALNAADVDTDMLKRFSAAIDNDNLEIVKFLNQPFKGGRERRHWQILERVCILAPPFPRL